ncbi:Oidioi.mRNA.OKI2018_I69.PAR.g12754.t1.cds [Oikopleura dioica]|uniref:Oidioi.mRNA.OKI2018_I69.PAR.g12754.t1.cds n=1 Tax=Oikopleura dioica TaxID=34765 RepID=A0ABN7S1I7_OIKDI|nr:Oidioi.mRNA.OKI2018_I69.PAR.g12754.t1.cds [Oikopleura dioica]
MTKNAIPCPLLDPEQNVKSEMGQNLERAVQKGFSDAGLLGIESAEVTLDSDINLNVDSGAIGIVVAVIVVLVIVIILVIALCSKYCCNCCDNLCFQGRGQNRLKKDLTMRDGQYGADYSGTINPTMSILPYEERQNHHTGCPSCGSQVAPTVSPSYAPSINRAPSVAASIFKSVKSGGNQVDGHSVMMPASIQYCTLPSGEVGMFIPQGDLMEVLEHSQVSKMGTIKSSNTMKYYSSTKKTGDSMRALEYPGKSCNYTTETEDGRKSREKRDQRKRRKRRTHRESSAKSHPRNPNIPSSGYKSDSSHSRSKSHSSRTFSSHSDEETVHRRRMTVIEETKKTSRSKKNLSNTEDPIFLQASIKELNFGTRQ